MKSEWQRTCETAYLVWKWTFKNPNKHVLHSPWGRILKLELNCPMFRKKEFICNPTCSGKWKFTNHCFKGAYLLFFYKPTDCLEFDYGEVYNLQKLQHQVYNIQKGHTRKSAAGWIASKIRRYIRNTWPESEVLIGT